MSLRGTHLEGDESGSFSCKSRMVPAGRCRALFADLSVPCHYTAIEPKKPVSLIHNYIIDKARKEGSIFICVVKSGHLFAPFRWSSLGSLKD